MTKTISYGSFVRCPNHETRKLIIELAHRVGRMNEDSATFRDKDDPGQMTWPVLRIMNAQGTFGGHMEDGDYEFTVGEMIDSLLAEDSVHKFRLPTGEHIKFTPGGEVTIGRTTYPASRVKRFIELYTK